MFIWSRSFKNALMCSRKYSGGGSSSQYIFSLVASLKNACWYLIKDHAFFPVDITAMLKAQKTWETYKYLQQSGYDKDIILFFTLISNMENIDTFQQFIEIFI